MGRSSGAPSRPAFGRRLLDDAGLAAALDALVSEYEQGPGGLTIHRAIDASLDVNDPVVSISIYRIAQEALTNAQRHARASGILVTLCLDGPMIRLDVEDDGVGMSSAPPSDGTHHGIANMHERAALLGGVLTIEAREGGGTRVSLRVQPRFEGESISSASVPVLRW